MGQQADAIVEHSLLNCNPEYVPNGVAIIRGNPTFSGKNFASLGCPVLVHELCHRKELNHSDRFWNEVSRILPDYKARKQWLKDNGPSLIARI